MSRMLNAIAAFDIRTQQRHDLFGRIAHSAVHTVIKKGILAVGDPVVRAVVHGAELALPLSHDLPRYVARFPYYDTVLPSLTRFLIQDGTVDLPLTFVDVGANVGDTVKLVSAAAGTKNISFICIEPDEIFLPLLYKNTVGLDVKVHSFLAASTTQQVNVTFRRNSGTSAIVTGSEPRPAGALDDVLSEQQVDLLKIDTDGYEVEVLRGLSRTFERKSPLVFIEFSPRHLRRIGGVDPRIVLEILRSAGYDEGLVYDYRGCPMGLTEFTDAAIRYLINYIRSDPEFYVDILLAKDHERLCRFYEFDIPRYIA